MTDRSCCPDAGTGRTTRRGAEPAVRAGRPLVPLPGQWNRHRARQGRAPIAKPQARACNPFVQPPPPVKGGLAFGGIQSGAIVIDRDRQTIRAQAVRFDPYPTRGPFAGVVHQVAEHFFQILPLAPKGQVSRDIGSQLQPLFAMDPAQHLDQPHHRRADFGACAQAGRWRQRSGPAQADSRSAGACARSAR